LPIPPPIIGFYGGAAASAVDYGMIHEWLRKNLWEMGVLNSNLNPLICSTLLVIALTLFIIAWKGGGLRENFLGRPGGDISSFSSMESSLSSTLRWGSMFEKAGSSRLTSSFSEQRAIDALNTLVSSLLMSIRNENCKIYYSLLDSA